MTNDCRVVMWYSSNCSLSKIDLASGCFFKMGLKEILCDNSQTFDFAFGIGIATLMVLFAITLIIVLILCVDNRRRRRIYKHKYRKCSTKEMETSKGLVRALTYMSYKIQNGQLKPSEIIKLENVCDLLKDKSMDEHRNMAAANIAFFFAAEPRTKSIVGSPSPKKSTEIQKTKTVYGRPQQSSVVVCGAGSPAGIGNPPLGSGSPPVGIVGPQQPSRPQTITVGIPPGTESTASNLGKIANVWLF